MMHVIQFIHRCPNMAIKEAEENDIMDDDDDDNIDADLIHNGMTDKKSNSLAESATGGKSQHKCGRKPMVCFITCTLYICRSTGWQIWHKGSSASSFQRPVVDEERLGEWIILEAVL